MEVNTVPVEENTVPTQSNPANLPAPVPTPKQRKKREPIVKPRTLEELDMLDPKKMTAVESALYISTLRDHITLLSAKCQELSKNATSAYEQFRNADAAYNEIKNQYNADLGLVKQIINTTAKTISLVGGQK